LKLKKKIIITIAVAIALIIFTGLGYLAINKYNNSYKKISEETKAKIAVIIKGSIGENPNLQTDSTKASWTDEAHAKQKEMMDKVLNTINIVGESRKAKPSKYITATFYDNMRLYIPYNEKNPQNTIVIEIVNHYFVVTAKEDDVRIIINYMNKQGVLK